MSFYRQTDIFCFVILYLSNEEPHPQIDVMMASLYWVLGALAFLAGALARESTWGGLYPRESGSREVKSLDGFWNFRLAPLHDPLQGFREEWFSKPLCKVRLI